MRLKISNIRKKLTPINILTINNLYTTFKLFHKPSFRISKILKLTAKIVILHQNPNYSH